MEAVKGSNLIYLYRILSEQSTAQGVRIALTTEDEVSISKDADATATKDGAVRGSGVAEIEKTCSSLMGATDEMIGKLKAAMLNDSVIEIWEANLDKPVSGGTNQFNGTYYQGYLTDMSVSSPADGNVTVDMTFGINGKGADGNVTVPTSQQDSDLYTFVDTTVQTQSH